MTERLVCFQSLSSKIVIDFTTSRVESLPIATSHCNNRQTPEARGDKPTKRAARLDHKINEAKLKDPKDQPPRAQEPGHLIRHRMCFKEGCFFRQECHLMSLSVPVVISKTSDPPGRATFDPKPTQCGESSSYIVAFHIEERCENSTGTFYQPIV